MKSFYDLSDRFFLKFATLNRKIIRKTKQPSYSLYKWEEHYREQTHQVNSMINFDFGKVYERSTNRIILEIDVVTTDRRY